MLSSPSANTAFTGPSEMHRRVSAHDWAKTPVGAVESWPQSLKSTVKTLLSSRYPMVLIWGPEFTQFYNDAYSVLIGDRHPAALGIDIRVTLAEGWDTLGPMIDAVMRTGVANWTPALPLEMKRAGYREEAYFSVSHAPAEDDAGRIVGMLAVCSEVTQQVLAERRTRLLRDLALQASPSQSVAAACRSVAAAIGAHPLDVPFALIYTSDNHDDALELAVAVGLEPGGAACPRRVVLGSGDELWPLERAYRGETIELGDADEHVSMRGGFFADPVRSALVMPLRSAGPAAPGGVLVVGVSPNRELDEAYRSFYELLAGQVSVALRNARAYEDERRRAEALAELDRAKTAFFSNVSHEFRTPLTLILGPLEDMLADADEPCPPRQAQRLELIRRNSLRLFKLVNTLLDFSRIEAGRVRASYEPTDLSAFTTDLVSLFRAAVERAGLTLQLDAPPLPEPVYVDREMWEKIVFNLLSNAVKFTFQGQISVELRGEANHAVLTVRDTGTGIPPEELPRLFQRFHRVQGAQSRSHEGSGIGLALVSELTKLHGGEVAVESAPSKGSAFFVKVPLGRAHLPAAQVQAAPEQPPSVAVATPFIDETMRWLPRSELADEALRPSAEVAPAPRARAAHSPESPERREDERSERSARILIVDDNADLRDYMTGLLGPSLRVDTAPDGIAGLRSAREHRPDLVLADVMMPGLDGFGLLRELRADPSTRDIPVVLLSARAGEESTIEGLEAGADDYLVKPFSARELLARVRTRLEINAMRREAIEHAQTIAVLEQQRQWTETVLNTMPIPLLFVEPGTGRITFANDAATGMAGGAFPVGTPADTYDTVFRLTDENDNPVSNEDVPAARAARGDEIRAAPVVWHTPAGRFSLLVDSTFLPEMHGHPATVALTLRDVSSLAKARAELEGAVRARDEFLAIASHELRTPLTPIEVHLYTLSRQAAMIAKDEDAQLWLEERIDKMRRQWERIRRLVAQLLAASSSSAEASPEPETLDLVELVESQVAERGGPAGGAGSGGCDVRVEADPSVVGCWNRFALEQLIDSLVSNACKFGGQRPVLIRVRREQQAALLSVRDEGIGIAREDQQRIFGRFERAVSARHYGGLGLGLYLARRAADALGATITVESELGSGSTFSVSLPLEAPDRSIRHSHDDSP